MSEQKKEIRPGFKLNCHDRNRNPLFESHDPSMMWDPETEMYYSYCTDSAITSPYKQGIPVRRSSDLVNFEFVGYALSKEAIEEGRDNGDFPPTGGFWAPYVEYVKSDANDNKGEYRMYYSATKTFGSSESRIWLAVSDKAEGPFQNRGIVMDTWFTDDSYPNAIDAHIIDDENGSKYLVYGSFFGGIFIKELNPATGMAKDGDAKKLGKRIAIKSEKSHVNGPEGAAMIYKSGYYYLFLSYGWLGDSYDIRVGRSKNVTGPFLDYKGKDLNGESLGMKLAGSYMFKATNPWATDEEIIDGNTKTKTQTQKKWSFGGFRGPGHGVPFYDPVRDTYFFVHHVRDGSKELIFKGHTHDNQVSYKMHYMVVRRMIFINDWPTFSPEPFAGEELDVISNNVNNDGSWEWLKFDYDNNEMAYSGNELISEDLLPLNAVIIPCFDFENSCISSCFTGYSNEGIGVWGKKRNVDKRSKK